MRENLNKIVCWTVIVYTVMAYLLPEYFMKQKVFVLVLSLYCFFLFFKIATQLKIILAFELMAVIAFYLRLVPTPFKYLKHDSIALPFFITFLAVFLVLLLTAFLAVKLALLFRKK